MKALALQWQDIDFSNRSIDVRRSVSLGRISTPKNSKTRLVDMSLQLTEALQAHKKRFKIVAADEGVPQFVFTNTIGTVIDHHNWRSRVFYNALQKAEIKRIRIHDLRHTYATLRISKGDNVADVSNQLGHHSVKLTMDVYYQWFPGKKKSEVDGLDDPSLMNPNEPYTNPEEEKALASNG